eukprot:353600-Chlamydomonas_euryale.AAC.3
MLHVREDISVKRGGGLYNGRLSRQDSIKPGCFAKTGLACHISPLPVSRISQPRWAVNSAFRLTLLGWNPCHVRFPVGCKVTKEEYMETGSPGLLDQMEAALRVAGSKPFVVPVGGSNALGTWGYLQV